MIPLNLSKPLWAEGGSYSMQLALPDPKRSVVVIFGASHYSKAVNFAAGEAFYMSANRVAKYLTGKHGLGIDPANLLNLFDDTHSAGNQLEIMAAFLSERQRLNSVNFLTENLFVYYVGHGLFTSDRKYCLAVRSTDENHVDISAIRGRELAYVIRINATHLRRFLVLDCCFAASMYGEFLSAPGEAAKTQLLDELPERGTTLLCASSREDVALAPKDSEYTMFSGALLKALRTGNRTLGPRMSVAELDVLIKQILKTEHPEGWVRPEVHSPDMRVGDISALPLFPNVAWSPSINELNEGVQDVNEGATRRKAEQDEAAEIEAAEIEDATRQRKAKHDEASEIQTATRPKGEGLTPQQTAYLHATEAREGTARRKTERDAAAEREAGGPLNTGTQWVAEREAAARLKAEERAGAAHKDLRLRVHLVYILAILISGGVVVVLFDTGMAFPVFLLTGFVFSSLVILYAIAISKTRN